MFFLFSSLPFLSAAFCIFCSFVVLYLFSFCILYFCIFVNFILTRLSMTMIFYLLSLPSPPLLLSVLLLFPFNASPLCQFRRDDLNLLKIIFLKMVVGILFCQMSTLLGVKVKVVVSCSGAVGPCWTSANTLKTHSLTEVIRGLSCKECDKWTSPF